MQPFNGQQEEKPQNGAAIVFSKLAGERYPNVECLRCRYERGETPVPKSLSQLLSLLNNHPDLLKEIEAGNPH